MSDRVFRSGDQVESLLQTDCIALVPLVTANATISKSDDPKAKLGPSNLKATAHGQNETWTIARSLFSRFFRGHTVFGIGFRFTWHD